MSAALTVKLRAAIVRMSELCVRSVQQGKIERADRALVAALKTRARLYRLEGKPWPGSFRRDVGRFH